MDLAREIPPLAVASDGTRYVTIEHIRQRWPDVTAARLRAWAHTRRRGGPLVQAVTVAELAAAVGRRYPEDRRLAHDPAGRRVYREHDVERAERLTRLSRVGRRRGISSTRD